MSIIKINGRNIPEPKKLDWEKNEIDSEDTDRNQEGTMFRDVIATKRKLVCEWPPLQNGDISVLINALDHPTFTLTFPDPKVGAVTTGTFYAGPFTASLYYWNEEQGKYLWSVSKVNFIEV